ncbi:MAG: cyclic nucleotide-binding domain-containing protein [Mariprofundaceae bacterium]|nr:cyclic nucleotide-binding domain-containing protein [Mariprofundaceae bacterium]
MYGKLVDLYPDDPRFLQRYAEVLGKLGKQTQAAKAIGKLHVLFLHTGDGEAAKALEAAHPKLGHQPCSAMSPTTTTLNFLSYLNSSLLDRLVMRLQQRSIKDGEYLFRQGEQGLSMFIIVEGEMSVLLPQHHSPRPVMLSLLKRGDVVGEMAMLQSGKRNADVIAVSDCKVLELKRQNFLKIIDEQGELGSSMMREVELRLRMTQISQNPILSRLPMQERQRLAQTATPFHMQHQGCIAEAGTLIKHVWLLTEGVADVVYQNQRGESHWLHDFRTGDLLGEQALIAKAAFPADIIAATDIQLLQLSMAVLKDLLGAYPWMELQLTALIDGHTTTSMQKIKRVRVKHSRTHNPD